MDSTSLLGLLKEFRRQNLQNFVPSALAYAFGRRPNFSKGKLRIRPNVKNTTSVIHWSYCYISSLFFQLPTAEQWYTAATAVFDVIFTKIDEENSDDSIAGRVNQTLVNHVDIGARFSDARCAKALPMAFSAYKEGLQSHYLQEVHNAKVKCLSKVHVF